MILIWNGGTFRSHILCANGSVAHWCVAVTTWYTELSNYICWYAMRGLSSEWLKVWRNEQAWQELFFRFVRTFVGRCYHCPFHWRTFLALPFQVTAHFGVRNSTQKVMSASWKVNNILPIFFNNFKRQNQTHEELNRASWKPCLVRWVISLLGNISKTKNKVGFVPVFSRQKRACFCENKRACDITYVDVYLGAVWRHQLIKLNKVPPSDPSPEKRILCVQFAKTLIIQLTRRKGRVLLVTSAGLFRRLALSVFQPLPAWDVACGMRDLVHFIPNLFLNCSIALGSKFGATVLSGIFFPQWDLVSYNFFFFFFFSLCSRFKWAIFCQRPCGEGLSNAADNSFACFNVPGCSTPWAEGSTALHDSRVIFINGCFYLF